MAAGACDFLHKPVQRTQINALWKHAHRGSRKRSGAKIWEGDLAAPSQSEDGEACPSVLRKSSFNADSAVLRSKLIVQK